jgi:predicted nucleotidyltransferase
MDKALLLADIKKAIAEKIGNDRLKGLFLFGSEARSTATDNSDIDILVLLEGPVRLASDLQEVISSPTLSNSNSIVFYILSLQIAKTMIPVNILCIEPLKGKALRHEYRSVGFMEQGPKGT